MKGSLEKHGTNWRMRVTVGYNEKGNPIRRSRMATAKNKRQAEKELALFIAEIEAGEYIQPQKMLFKDFIEEWLQKYAKTNLQKTTVSNYIHILNTHIIPTLGHKKVEDIKTIHLVTLFHENLPTKGLATTTINSIHTRVKMLFKKACEWEFIKKNPMDGVSKLKGKKQEMQPYDQKEIIKILALTEQEEEMNKMLFQLAIVTGMRRGELLGLEWGHIDFDNDMIHIQQTVVRAGKEILLKEPKTSKSKRTISIPPAFTAKLKQYKKHCAEKRIACGDLWEGEEHFFLFSTWTGKPLTPEKASSRWQYFTQKHGLRHIKLHGLRSTHATYLLTQGENLKVISERLGHSDIQTTMNIYAHVLEEANKKASSHFETLLAQTIS
ncbi:tyrosine-type recombinase/integrase [Bacillus cereus]|uniref:tyrosine-type recombinase/integrase n=1 Tax=Bacillus cereus TaxID=1396 RepID=UPI000BFA1D45|nr:tyrosine-type recombinase/integrase [Bacillus cereus]PFL46652.1 site-specific integrase [Bacillus cereus]